MDEAPLTRPSHLDPVDTSRRAWLARRPAAAVAAALGIVAFIAALLALPDLGADPDWRITVPGLAATAIASVVSIARREPGAHCLWLVGLGLAAAGVALGWILALIGVIAFAAVVIAILSSM